MVEVGRAALKHKQTREVGKISVILGRYMLAFFLEFVQVSLATSSYPPV